MEHLEHPSLLVATPQMLDDNFAQCLILLFEHNAEGAFGIITNKPTHLPLGAIIKDSNLSIPPSIPTWTGGPVGRDQGLILTTDSDVTFGRGDFVCDFFRFVSSDDALKKLVESANSKPESLHYSYRFVVGYAGWGPGQLDQEIKEGSWLTLPYDHSLVFKTAWTRMWSSAYDKVGLGVHANLSPQPNSYLQ